MTDIRRATVLAAVAIAATVVPLSLCVATLLSLKPTTELGAVVESGEQIRVLARDTSPLTATYRNRWNVHHRLTLNEVPLRLRNAVIHAEDRRFFDHGGVDWQARAHALWQNVRHLRRVRGASTITEQVVRMIHPRPRTLWSRWLEGFEASRLEALSSKHEILEFYLNQVPYAANRRGVAQAARYYFDRGVDTLSPVESLALAVLVRAPSRFDLWKDPRRAQTRIDGLARSMRTKGIMSPAQHDRVRSSRLELRSPRLDVEAPHFVRHVQARTQRLAGDTISTTLDPDLQVAIQTLLDEHLIRLGARNVKNAAALLVDHRRNEILAWNVGGSARADTPGRFIDAVLTPRQPGSTLKPFVYAMALERGWTAATLIDDAPLAESVGTGLHEYHNYSRRHYGLLTLRESLGNSLNIPAVKTLQYVGTEAFLARLNSIGITSLDQHPDRYGDGLALGNGEVSLYALVQAYSVLARRGRYTPLTFHRDEASAGGSRVFSEDVTSIIGHILSDPAARRLEFGDGSILNLPVQTAVKTGTSNDHRDSWAIGYDHRYTFGVWMGNLDRTSTDEITGSTGPAYVLRAVFARLARSGVTRPLYFSPSLLSHSICVPAASTQNCHARQEWFIPGTQPVARAPPPSFSTVFIRHPSPGLELALDPRIPDEHEAFRLSLSGDPEDYRSVEWFMDERALPGNAPTHLWSPTRGSHTVRARVWRHHDSAPIETAGVSFQVH